MKHINNVGIKEEFALFLLSSGFGHTPVTMICAGLLTIFSIGKHIMVSCSTFNLSGMQIMDCQKPYRYTFFQTSANHCKVK